LLNALGERLLLLKFFLLFELFSGLLLREVVIVRHVLREAIEEFITSALAVEDEAFRRRVEVFGADANSAFFIAVVLFVVWTTVNHVLKRRFVDVFAIRFCRLKTLVVSVLLVVARLAVPCNGSLRWRVWIVYGDVGGPREKSAVSLTLLGFFRSEVARTSDNLAIRVACYC